MRLGFVGLFCLIGVTLQLRADSVLLKDGTVFEGRFNSIQNDKMIFDTPDGVVEISSDKIVKIEIDYNGFFLCYALKNDPKRKICTYKLQEITGKTAYLSSLQERVHRKEISLADVVFFQFKKNASSKKEITSLLSEKMNVSLDLRDERVEEGIISEIDKSKKTLVIKKKGGEEAVLSEADITGGRLIPEKPREAFYWWSIFPGVPQFVRGEYVKSGLIVSGFGLMGAGFVSEYRAAVATNAAANSDLMFLLLGMNAGSYRQRFQGHQRNQRILAGGMVMLYAYHLLDAYGMDRLFSGRLKFGYNYGYPSEPIQLAHPYPRTPVHEVRLTFAY